MVRTEKLSIWSGNLVSPVFRPLLLKMYVKNRSFVLVLALIEGFPSSLRFWLLFSKKMEILTSSTRQRSSSRVPRQNMCFITQNISSTLIPSLQILLNMSPMTCSQLRVLKYYRFIKSFVVQNCLKIMVDIGKHEPLTDGFVHFQMLKYCQNTKRMSSYKSHMGFISKLFPTRSRFRNHNFTNAPWRGWVLLVKFPLMLSWIHTSLVS